MIIRGTRCMGWPRKSLFSQVLEDSMKRSKSWLEIEKKSCRKTEKVGDILSAETLLESGMVSKANLCTVIIWCMIEKHWCLFLWVSLLYILKWSVYVITLWSTFSTVLFCVTSHTSQPLPVIILFYFIYLHTVTVWSCFCWNSWSVNEDCDCLSLVIMKT